MSCIIEVDARQLTRSSAMFGILFPLPESSQKNYSLEETDILSLHQHSYQNFPPKQFLPYFIQRLSLFGFSYLDELSYFSMTF